MNKRQIAQLHREREAAVELAAALRDKVRRLERKIARLERRLASMGG